jgi:hypothetical protein
MIELSSGHRARTTVRPVDTTPEGSPTAPTAKPPTAEVTARVGHGRPKPGDRTGPASRRAEQEPRERAMAERFARGAAPADHAPLAEPYARLSAPVRAHAEALDRSLEDRVPNMLIGGGAMGPVGASGDSGAQPARAAEGGPPSRRIVDPRTGLESVSIEDFRTYGNSVIAAGP